MAGQLAHNINDTNMSPDIILREEIPFNKMRLQANVKKGLQESGYNIPTRIQALSIPTGNMGVDILVQSNSGTGKTIIYTVILLEKYRPKVQAPQSLVLVPTREIAIQVADVINRVGQYCEGFSCVYIIGGTNVADDRKKLEKAKAIVGTPGRLNHLIDNNALNMKEIELLVLDEADQLYGLRSLKTDIMRIRRHLKIEHQTIACSATLTDALSQELAQFMRNSLRIAADSKPMLLLGITQFVYDLPEPINSMLEMNSKLDAVKHIFACFPFKQCLIFADSQSRADSYCNELLKDGWSASLITGAQTQQERIEVFDQLRTGRTRILVSTDLFARGIDSMNLNLIINLELPANLFTYMHRLGRASRFGSPGVAITIIAKEQERQHFSKLISEVGNGMAVFNFPKNSEIDINFWDYMEFEEVIEKYGLFGQNEPTKSIECVQQPEVNSTSSIDTKTFRIDSADSALHIIDIPMEGTEAYAQQKITPESHHTSSQHLPSSNTIDDASSIAPDSVRSSVPSIMDLLVDNDERKPGLAHINLYDDYKMCMEHKTHSQSKPDVDGAASNLSSLLIDKNPTPVNELGDVYNDYFNFEKSNFSSATVDNSKSYQVPEEGKLYPSLAHNIQTQAQNEECHSSLLQESAASFSKFGNGTSSTLSNKQIQRLTVCKLEQIDIQPEPVMCSLCSAVVLQGVPYDNENETDPPTSTSEAAGASASVSASATTSSTLSNNVNEMDSAGRLILFQRPANEDVTFNAKDDDDDNDDDDDEYNNEDEEEDDHDDDDEYSATESEEEANETGNYPFESADFMSSLNVSNATDQWFQLFRRQLNYLHNYADMIRAINRTANPQ